MLKKDISEQELALLCREQNSDAQFYLYKKYSGKMMALCMRYASSREDAEDLMQEGFIEVFRNIGQYRGEGSLEGWIRTLMIRLSIRKWRKQGRNHTESVEEHFALHDNSLSAIDQLSLRELLHIISGLPNGYRMVFNLYVIDGYSHAEIAEMTGIQESTSRTQLMKARIMLQKIITGNVEIRAKYIITDEKQTG
jgi:RNA polymerase sigma factor (sigma-70 family)